MVWFGFQYLQSSIYHRDPRALLLMNVHFHIHLSLSIHPSLYCPDLQVQLSQVSLVMSPRFGGAGGGPRRSVA